MSELMTLDRAFQTTRVWINELAKDLGWTDKQKVYTALRAVLHAIRDRVTLEEAVQFGAELPTFIRGLYYEGWQPGAPPARNRRKQALIQEVQDIFLKARMPRVDPEAAVEGIFRFLNRKIATGELADVRGQLPKAVRSLWPEKDRVA
jgi:uncharacterized protein (DUF2267 family)